jgi:hypothetical protein
MLSTAVSESQSVPLLVARLCRASVLCISGGNLENTGTIEEERIMARELIIASGRGGFAVIHSANECGRAWARLCCAMTLGFRCLAPAGAAGQPTAAERGCINALNKAGRSVVQALSKDLVRCIRTYGNGTVASAQACSTADTKGRVARAKDKTRALETSKCDSGPPPFGPQDAIQVNDAAVQKEARLYARVFGADLDAGITLKAANRFEFRCQKVIARDIAKCQDARMSTFNRCKKAGMGREKTIASGLELQDVCLGTGSNPQPDPRLRIFDRCRDVTKRGLFKDMVRQCAAANVLLEEAFSEGECAMECAFTANDCAACIERLIGCEVCLWANATDVLNRDCDLFDDGTYNGSCGGAAP